jgi:hypothetical protein
MTDGDRARARIEAELAKLGHELSPPVGWQARVLAAVAEPPRRRWWRLALPALAAAAALAIALWVIARPPPRPTVELALALDRSGAVLRGDAAHVGDVVTATARGRAVHRAVWIFRDAGELVVACPGAAGCRATEGALTATAALQLPGSYAIVALTSNAPIPPPTPSYDASVAAAEAAGALRRTETLTVR